ncbi:MULTISPECIES: hypothetical protein [Rhodopseudomonas]|nr:MULTISPECIES: hypothetical protein [Rhodopseudomonas]MDF3810558.1 hypothetical protein [Rhodopseudomonas sp. BAL398]WOK18384.1 hypothetical protein RBJ75_02300 [Rhodopseudomonas sp. BAL398]
MSHQGAVVIIPDRWGLRVLRPALAGLGALLAVAAHGQSPIAFDKPLRVAEVPPTSSDDGRTLRCSYYPDVMVREVTDGPSATPPSIVPGPNPPCDLTPPAGASPIALEDMMLDGRIGAYLLFSAMDPHGATDFGVVNAATGATLFKDAAYGDPTYQEATLDNDALRLRYKRGITAGCSLMQDPASCWASLVEQGLIPKDMAKQPPSAQLCDAAYKDMQAAPDNPSIVTYDVEILISPDGTNKPLSRGAVACESLP